MNADTAHYPEPRAAAGCGGVALLGAAAPSGAAWAWIALLGLGHLVIECASSFALTRTLDDSDLAAGAVLVYNAVAFWGQPLVGWTADRWRCGRALVMGGALLLVAGLASLGALPWLTVALIAAGNACYHVGGGVLAIRLSRRRVGGLGLFVGPGAIGLTLGVGLARMGFVMTPWALGALAALLTVALWRMGGRGSSASLYGPVEGAAPSAPFPISGADGAAPSRIQHQNLGYAGSSYRVALVVALVLACIAIRAFVGTGFAFEWGGSAVAALAVAAALAGGKIVGGFLADRFGWLPSTVVVLALSVPALWFGRTSMPAGLAGVALFQAPMAVTLGALVWALPRQPGLAFGLASAAVYAGGFPLLAGQVPWLHTFAGLSCLSLAAAVMLAVGVRGKTCK